MPFPVIVGIVVMIFPEKSPGMNYPAMAQAVQIISSVACILAGHFQAGKAI